jgi:hypothetical protein
MTASQDELSKAAGKWARNTEPDTPGLKLELVTSAGPSRLDSHVADKVVLSTAVGGFAVANIKYSPVLSKRWPQLPLISPLALFFFFFS